MKYTLLFLGFVYLIGIAKSGKISNYKQIEKITVGKRFKIEVKYF